MRTFSYLRKSVIEAVMVHWLGTLQKIVPLQTAVVSLYKFIKGVSCAKMLYMSEKKNNYVIFSGEVPSRDGMGK